MAPYAVLGQCEFITVIEAADNETVAHLSVDLGSRGTVNIVSLPAIPIADLRAKLKGPKQNGSVLDRTTTRLHFDIPPTTIGAAVQKRSGGDGVPELQVSGVNVPLESTTPRVPLTLQSLSPALVAMGGAARARSSSDPSDSIAKTVTPAEST